MNQQSIYQAWKGSQIGKVIGSGECVPAIRSYLAAANFPASSPFVILPSVKSAKDLAGHNNSYLTWIANDHNNPNQLPEQGDVMIFGATPATGYTNQTNNPDGHAGVCDAATSAGYELTQQNAPHAGSPLNTTAYAWKYRPCLGWYRLNAQISASQTGSTTEAAKITPVGGKTLYLPASVADWHVYNPNGPYDLAHAKAVLHPAKYGGLSYQILSEKPNGVVLINTLDFGQVAVWTQGTSAVIR